MLEVLTFTDLESPYHMMDPSYLTTILSHPIHGLNHLRSAGALLLETADKLEPEAQM